MGARWKCLVCEDFDFCATCYRELGLGRSGVKHDPSHDFQLMIGRNTRVRLSEGYEAMSDAAGGPLRPGDEGRVVR